MSIDDYETLNYNHDAIVYGLMLAVRSIYYHKDVDILDDVLCGLEAVVDGDLMLLDSPSEMINIEERVNDVKFNDEEKNELLKENHLVITKERVLIREILEYIQKEFIE